MPFETIVVVAIIVAVFGFLMSVLAFVDWTSGGN